MLNKMAMGTPLPPSESDSEEMPWEAPPRTYSTTTSGDKTITIESNDSDSEMEYTSMADLLQEVKDKVWKSPSTRPYIVD